MSNSSVKGYAFEYFVKNLLIGAGFQQVPADDTVIYNSPIGTMIHGLGQPHNADILVSPPIQIPFYFPTRLLVECKCYEDSLGIEFARNVFGLREDINSFDILTPEILKKRRNYKRKGTALYNYDRYNYQVLLASMSGFKYTTEEFAQVHRIPLMNFSESNIFSNIREFIYSVDKINSDLSSENKKLLLKKFKGINSEWNESNTTLNHANEINDFFIEVREMSQNINIGVLENGTIIFLFKNRKENSNVHNESYDDGYKLFWADEGNCWRLEVEEYNYFFELPENLLKIWDNEVKKWENDFEIRERALSYKERYFPKIIMYDNFDGKTKIEILNISRSFLQRAAENISRRSNEN